MLELLDERVSIVYVVIYQLTPIVIMRIAFLYTLHDEVGVPMVVSKDNRLADCFPAIDLKAPFYHLVDDFIDSILVVHRIEDTACCDLVRRFIIKRLIELFPLLIGTFPIGDAAT